MKAPRKPRPSEFRAESQLSSKDTDGQAAEEFPGADTPTTGNKNESSDGETYLVDRLESIDGNSNLYRVRWAGYNDSDDTWEPPANTIFNLTLRYHRSHRANPKLRISVSTLLGGQ